MHKCKNKCPLCCKFFLNEKCSGIHVHCDICNKDYNGYVCFEEHRRVRGKINGMDDSVCNRLYKCPLCDRIIQRPKNINDEETHVCGYAKCPNCRTYTDLNTHKCYLISKELPGGYCTGNECDEENKKCFSCKTRTEKYCFYDFETYEEDTTRDHIMNYGVLQEFHGKLWKFTNIEDFCKFIFSKDKAGFRFKDYTFVAHNAKGYDLHFILKYCIEHNLIKPENIIKNGTKMLQLVIKESKIRFIDSLCFVQQKLSEFPKTFGLGRYSKRFFPTSL